MNSIDLVIPSIPSDIDNFLRYRKYLERFLSIKNIIVIGNQKVESHLSNDSDIHFINENEFVDIEKIKEIIFERTGDKKSTKRAGWYAQQFIKMGYSRNCKEEYYLLWDSDTIPLKNISFFEGKNPVFDCKTEYHKAYFQTISDIFPGLKKRIKKSFISEHMIINSTIMRELIEKIESYSLIKGNSYVEKIMYAVPEESLAFSGFSEFETYGTYTTTMYPNLYKIREWKSMRYGSFFFNDTITLSDEDIKWLSKFYDAISFEKIHSLSFVSKIINMKYYKKIFGPTSLEIWGVMVRCYNRIRNSIS